MSCFNNFEENSGRERTVTLNEIEELDEEFYASIRNIVICLVPTWKLNFGANFTDLS